MSSTIVHIGQSRAETAYKFAKKGVKKSNYASYVKRFPMIIKTNGLTYALSFAYSKGKVGAKGGDDAWEAIFKQSGEWLKDEPNQFIADRLSEVKEKPQKLMEVLVALDHEELMWVTTEIVELFNWLKRFAHE
jgi:CRISPR-associated protein Cmr5